MDLYLNVFPMIMFFNNNYNLSNTNQIFYEIKPC